MCSSRDQKSPSADELLADTDRLSVDKMSSTLDHFDAPLLQHLGTLELVDLFDGLAQIGAHIRHLDDRRISVNTESGSCTNFMCYFCCLEERLARHTACPSAVTPDPILLDQSYFCPELR